MGMARLFLGILLCSTAAISFEITLTRVFSISLWYHFAFMVISIAMLGIGLSGTVLSLFPNLRDKKLLGFHALALAASMVMGYAGTNIVHLDSARLAWDMRQLYLMGLYYLFLALPFFFFGLVVSTSFALESERSQLVYGADLLGAGTGSVAAIVFVSGFGPETGVLATAACALLGAAVLGRPRAAAFMLLLVTGIGIMNPSFMRIRMSEYKGLEQALRFPGAEHLKTYYSGFYKVDTFRSPIVRFAPGMSLKYLETLPDQIGIAVDGTGINAITEAAGNTTFLRYLPSALPYEITKRDSALIVEPRGGLPVLLAREYSTGHIEKAESNSLMVYVIRNDYNSFSGGIYEKNTHKKLARSALLTSDKKFDIIDISLEGSVPSGLFGMTEDYTFTVEAFRQYLDHLTDNGVLSLNMYLIPPPRTELRLLATGVSALEESGSPAPERHIAAIRSWGSITMLIKKSALDMEELSALRKFAADRNFDLVYYPGIAEAETNIYVRMPDNAYFKAFTGIIDSATRDAFLRDYVFDVSPVRDEIPFFHHYLRLSKLEETMEVMGGKWQFFIDEGYWLPVALAQVLVLSAVLLLLPAFKTRGHARPSLMLLYFAFLGLGFMFVEVPLIQGMMLPLENPSYAVAVVLASVLVCSGTGSILSQRFPSLRAPRTVFALALLIIPYGFALPSLAAVVAAFPLKTKFVLSFLLVAPTGALMGIPFPMGIRLLGEKNPGLIPWAWAVNGCFSVLGPVLATMLALGFGFKVVFIAGALMYSGAFVVIRREWISRT